MAIRLACRVFGAHLCDQVVSHCITLTPCGQVLAVPGVDERGQRVLWLPHEKALWQATFTLDALNHGGVKRDIPSGYVAR